MDTLDDRISGRVVVAGVGCAGRGDDCAGRMLARGLSGRPGVCALDCEDRPEDFTGDIARERPDTVLIADAVDMGGRPGDVALLEAEEVALTGFDTHRASLGIVMRYLRERTGARVLLLGIQPSRLSDRAGLSPEVAASVGNLARLLSGLETPSGGGHDA